MVARAAETGNPLTFDTKASTTVPDSSIIEVRRPTDNRVWSTNHFESKELSNEKDPNEPTTCGRYKFLSEELPKGKVDVEMAKKLLAGVADPEMTIQSMVFRPATLELWLSCGKVPSTSGEFHRLDVRALFGAAGKE